VLAHYVGLTGVGTDAAGLPVTDPRAGFFGCERTFALEDVKDGTSNTLLAVETASQLGPWAAGGAATARAVDPGGQPYVGRGRPFGRDHYEQAVFVKTPAGANAVMLDGSVRYLSESISARTFEALVTPAAGDAVGGDF
jgi:Protein of unknown function (DUF1559)